MDGLIRRSGGSSGGTCLKFVLTLVIKEGRSLPPEVLETSVTSVLRLYGSVTLYRR